MLNSDGVFRRVTVLLAVLMKGVGEGKEECRSLNTPRKMLKVAWKDQQYVERTMHSLVKETTLLKLADQLLTIQWKQRVFVV